MQPNNEILVKFMTVFTIISLTWNDIVCGAIITSYSVHCQLNISYIGNLVSGVREKRIDFQVNANSIQIKCLINMNIYLGIFKTGWRIS